MRSSDTPELYTRFLYEKFLRYSIEVLQLYNIHWGEKMKFELRQLPAKEESIYKTLYIKRSLADHIEEIASENSTSFNNVVISMIESCLKEE